MHRAFLHFPPPGHHVPQLHSDGGGPEAQVRECARVQASPRLLQQTKYRFYMAVGFTAVTDYAIYLVYQCSGKEPGALQAVPLRTAEALLDLYLACLFVRAIQFLQAMRLEKLDEDQQGNHRAYLCLP